MSERIIIYFLYSRTSALEHILRRDSVHLPTTMMVNYNAFILHFQSNPRARFTNWFTTYTRNYITRDSYIDAHLFRTRARVRISSCRLRIQLFNYRRLIIDNKMHTLLKGEIYNVGREKTKKKKNRPTALVQ